MKQLRKQAGRFFIVGILAMATHFAVFSTLTHLGIAPLIANALAFTVAFQVSFWGHFLWSFQMVNTPRFVALRRFLLVAIGSFLVNEVMLAALLKWTPLPDKLALLIVLFTVAGGTFLLSKFWAFSHSHNAA